MLNPFYDFLSYIGFAIKSNPNKLTTQTEETIQMENNIIQNKMIPTMATTLLISTMETSSMHLIHYQNEDVYGIDKQPANVIELPASKIKFDFTTEASSLEKPTLSIAIDKSLTTNDSKTIKSSIEMPIEVIIGHNKSFITTTGSYKSSDSHIKTGSATIKVSEIQINRSNGTNKSDFYSLENFLEKVSEKSGWYAELVTNNRPKGNIEYGGGGTIDTTNNLNNLDNFNVQLHQPVKVLNTEKNKIVSNSASLNETIKSSLSWSTPRSSHLQSNDDNIENRNQFPIYTHAKPASNRNVINAQMEHTILNQYLMSNLKANMEKSIIARHTVLFPIRTGLETGNISNNQKEIWN